MPDCQPRSLARTAVTAGVAYALWSYVSTLSPTPGPHLPGSRAAAPARGRAGDRKGKAAAGMERGKAKKENQRSLSSRETAGKVEKEKKDLEVKSKEKGKEKGKEEERKKSVELKNKKGKEIGKGEEKGKEVGPKIDQKKEKEEEKRKSVDVKTKENGKDKGKEEEKKKSVDLKRKSVDSKTKETGKEKEEEKRKSLDSKTKETGKDKEEEKRKSVDSKTKENEKDKGKEEKKKNDVKGENGTGPEAKEEQGTEKEKEQVTEQVKENSSTSIKTLYPPPVKNKQILVLGLDGAGKTSVLHLLASNTVQHSTAPTQGFNAVHINSEDRQMEFLEIGGSEPFRSFWEMYLPNGWLLIFVVDSADHKRLPEAKKYLHQLIDPNPELPLVIFANKQDLGAAYRITDIHDALALSEVGNDRKVFLFGTQVTKNGSEIPSTMQDAKDLIAHLAINM